MQHADPTKPRITDAFLKYAQARGFVIDTARVRKPKDKARVERSVRDVRDDCFAGERIRELLAARAHAERWCRDDYGARRHSTTGRMPREHFLNVEAQALLPASEQPYDVPRWSTPKVARDHFVQVERALYSMPTRLIGRKLRVRVDRSTVRFYDRDQLIRICERLPPGKRRVDPDDYSKGKRAYAMRDIEFLQKQADERGPNIGAFVRRLLAGPQPWTRMRTVYGVLALAKRHRDVVVDRCCALALANDMLSLKRLTIMAERDPQPHPAPIARPLPPARFLRPPDLRTQRRQQSRRSIMTDTLSPDLKSSLKRLKLGPMLDTLPERLALARQQKTPHQDFLLMLLTDEISRRDSLSSQLRAHKAHLDAEHQLEAWDSTAQVRFDLELWAELDGADLGAAIGAKTSSCRWHG